MNNLLSKIVSVIGRVLVCSMLTIFAASVTATELKAFSIERVNAESYGQLALTFDNESSCCAPLFSASTLQAFESYKPAYQLETLFSSQKGSWMFQSFVNNGLFKVASRYQPYHPKAIMLTNGVADLEWLFKSVNDPSVIAKEGQQYRLYYPLIIGKHAALKVQGSLELNADAGVAIINLGTLVINNSIVTSSSTSTSDFKSFITAWNNSKTYIHQSEIKGLGYDGYLSQGISIAQNNSLDDAQNQTAWIEVIDSQFSDMQSALMLAGAKGVIRRNIIEGAKRYGIYAQSSELLIEKNQVRNSDGNSGLHLQASFPTIVRKNTFENNQKAGVSIGGEARQVSLIGNQVLGNNGAGLLVETLSSGDTIQIKGNIIAHNSGSGVRVNGVGTYQIDQNIFIANQNYAISIKDNKEGSDHLLLITQNQFVQNQNELIQSEGIEHLIFGSNKFNLKPGVHSVFSGELQSIQASVLQNTYSKNDVVEIKVKSKCLKRKSEC